MEVFQWYCTLSKKRSRVNISPQIFFTITSIVYNFSGKFKLRGALIKTISSIGMKKDQESREGERLKECKLHL